MLVNSKHSCDTWMSVRKGRRQELPSVVQIVEVDKLCKSYIIVCGRRSHDRNLEWTDHALDARMLIHCSYISHRVFDSSAEAM